MGQASGFPRTSDSEVSLSSPIIVIGGSDPVSSLVRPGVISTANQLSQITQPSGLIVAGPGQWSVNVNAAGGVAATVTKAAGGAGVRHVAQALIAALLTNAAATSAPVIFIRDGASGVGTPILNFNQLIVSAFPYSVVYLSGLNLFGSPNTAMTLEYSSSPANVFESLTLLGYSTQ